MASPKPATKVSLVGIVLAVLAAIFYPRSGEAPADGTPSAPPSRSVPSQPAPTETAETPKATPKPAPKAPAVAASKVGFTSQRSWQDHFAKHGAEFGDITAEQYLAKAQELRDAPLSKDVLEVRRESDGVISRFDRKTGGFVAFHEDKTIRTFFRPNDGEAYFRRQAQR